MYSKAKVLGAREIALTIDVDTMYTTSVREGSNSTRKVFRLDSITININSLLWLDNKLYSPKYGEYYHSWKCRQDGLMVAYNDDNLYVSKIIMDEEGYRLEDVGRINVKEALGKVKVNGKELSETIDWKICLSGKIYTGRKAGGVIGICLETEGITGGIIDKNTEKKDYMVLARIIGLDNLELSRFYNTLPFVEILENAVLFSGTLDETNFEDDYSTYWLTNGVLGDDTDCEWEVNCDTTFGDSRIMLLDHSFVDNKNNDNKNNNNENKEVKYIAYKIGNKLKSLSVTLESGLDTDISSSENTSISETLLLVGYYINITNITRSEDNKKWAEAIPIISIFREKRYRTSKEKRNWEDTITIKVMDFLNNKTLFSIEDKRKIVDIESYSDISAMGWYPLDERGHIPCLSTIMLTNKEFELDDNRVISMSIAEEKGKLQFIVRQYNDDGDIRTEYGIPIRKDRLSLAGT